MEAPRDGLLSALINSWTTETLIWIFKWVREVIGDYMACALVSKTCVNFTTNHMETQNICNSDTCACFPWFRVAFCFDIVLDKIVCTWDKRPILWIPFPTSLGQQSHFFNIYLLFRCYSYRTRRCCECHEIASHGSYCQRYVAETQQTMNTETIYEML